MWFLALAACAGRTPDLTPIDGRLPPCPTSPNCVCSEPGEDAEHAIAPIPVPPDRSVAEVTEALAAVVRASPRTELLRREEGFLHATFRTPTLRFVDDVAFRVDAEAGVVHVRSASRLGQGDLGVNRRRVEALRAQLAAAFTDGRTPPAP